MHFMSGITSRVLEGVPTFLLAGDGKFDPMRLDPDGWSLVFWTGISFLILLGLLAMFAWRPILSAVKSREDKITGDLARAEEARREAEEAREKHRREMEEAAQQVKAMLAEARERSEKVAAEIQAEARERASADLEKARRTIEAEKQAAIREIKDQVVDLSLAITSRLVGQTGERGDYLQEADRLMADLERSV